MHIYAVTLKLAVTAGCIIYKLETFRAFTNALIHDLNIFLGIAQFSLPPGIKGSFKKNKIINHSSKVLTDKQKNIITILYSLLQIYHYL